MVILAGGGFMFTVQELATAAELKQPLPIIIWNDDSLRQIRDDMVARNIPPTGVDLVNPDFVTLAEAFGCHGVQPDSLGAFKAAVVSALQAQMPTLIEVHQDADWLT